MAEEELTKALDRLMDWINSGIDHMSTINPFSVLFLSRISSHPFICFICKAICGDQY